MRVWVSYVVIVFHTPTLWKTQNNHLNQRVKSPDRVRIVWALYGAQADGAWTLRGSVCYCLKGTLKGSEPAYIYRAPPEQGGIHTRLYQTPQTSKKPSKFGGLTCGLDTEVDQISDTIHSKSNGIKDHKSPDIKFHLIEWTHFTSLGLHRLINISNSDLYFPSRRLSG